MTGPTDMLRGEAEFLLYKTEDGAPGGALRRRDRLALLRQIVELLPTQRPEALSPAADDIGAVYPYEPVVHWGDP